MATVTTEQSQQKPSVVSRDGGEWKARPNLEKCQILLLKGLELDTMTGDKMARGHEARQLSPRLNINKAEASGYFVSRDEACVPWSGGPGPRGQPVSLLLINF